MGAETQWEREKPREVADDSVSAAEDIALKDTTRGLREIEFQEEKDGGIFSADPLPQLRPSKPPQQWPGQNVTHHIYKALNCVTSLLIYYLFDHDILFIHAQYISYKLLLRNVLGDTQVLKPKIKKLYIIHVEEE